MKFSNDPFGCCLGAAASFFPLILKCTGFDNKQRLKKTLNRKIKIRYNITQSNAFMNTSNSWGLSVNEADEPRIRAETLGKLADGLACIHSIDGILIAEVKDS